AGSGTLLVMALGGRDPETGQAFVASELAAGGMGARPWKDGIDAIETDVSNCMNIPVESVEMSFPVRIPRAGLCTDSGGAGQFWGDMSVGSGYGGRLERDTAQVLADVLGGKLSHESARETYGVVLVSVGDGVDELGTKECREALRRGRGPITWTFDRGVDGRR